MKYHHLNYIIGLVCKTAALFCGAILKHLRDIIFLDLTIISECQLFSRDDSPPLMMKRTEVTEIKAASCCLFLPSSSDCPASFRQTSSHL